MVSLRSLPLYGLSPLVTLLVILFGSGAWVAVNGLWVELPLLVEELPEKWTLPSYLTVLIQVANISPLTLFIVNKIRGKPLPESPLVYAIVSVGAVSCLLLAFFWQRTAWVGGEEHSVALFALFLTASLVDCTTSVVFLPFMGVYRAGYMSPYYIGEGLSGLAPGLLALAQGAGSTTCVNMSVTVNNATEYQVWPVHDPPRFSPSQFFYFPFAMMIVCGVAFLLLEKLPVARAERTENSYNLDGKGDGEGLPSGTVAGLEVTGGCRVSSNRLDGSGRTLSSQERELEHLLYYYTSETALVRSAQSSAVTTPGEIDDLELKSVTSSQVVVRLGLARRHVNMLLGASGWAACLSMGVLPAIQTYTVLPYGQTSYHLAVTLSSIANPLACVCAMFVTSRNPHVPVIIIGMASIIGGYLIVLAAQSPNPVLVGCTSGSALAVTAWVLLIGLVSYGRATAAALLQREGKQVLRWCGYITQLGAFIGAVATFIAVTVFKVLQDAPTCREMPSCRA